MEFHKVLKRQLTRLELSEDKMPTDVKSWHDLLNHINRFYLETDQERYLLERSMEISSREMHELNKKLENAQSIAKLGYWVYDKTNEKTIWSNEIFYMLGLDPTDAPPTYEEAIQLIYEKDRANLTTLVERAFKDGVDYDTEIRMKSYEGEYRWYHVIGHPHEDKIERHVLSGVIMDITRRKKMEEEVEQLNQQLLTSARRAGMADVATSILHNVGNILNSANVSLNIIKETSELSIFKKLYAISEILNEHSKDLDTFLTQNEQGKAIPAYLINLIEKIKQAHDTLNSEISTLREQINHIKDITAMQKELSGTSRLYENVSLCNLIDTSLRMSGNILESKEITLIKNCPDFDIVTDKSKLLQILVNLIQNACDALIEAPVIDKIIHIDLLIDKINKCITLTIKDNGTGILKENLTRIFAFGFTTKKKGHGFGLHSSALAAKELGGKLEAKSEGSGLGSEFILTLPFSPTEKISCDSTRKITV